MRRVPRFSLVAAASVLALACGGGGTPAGPATTSPDAGTSSGPPAGPAPGPTPGDPGDAGAPADGAWVTVAAEDFEHLALGDPPFAPDVPPDDGPYSDAGSYFRGLGVVPPAAFRLARALGAGGWLTAESYTRSAATRASDLLSVVPDPANPANHVLRLASPAHSDATIVRSSAPLPERYRVSLRAGFARFGDGRPGLNGYPADVTAGPWRTDSVTTQNGFYWLTILDATPRPHNSTWIHHHRKVVIDSDNNWPVWSEIFDGQRFVASGEHPVMMMAIDGRGERTAQTGEPFIPWSAGAWQPAGTIRAVDAYLDGEWYDVSVERDGTRFTLQISGRFRHGGTSTYRATIDAAERCVWHFNRSPSEDASRCVDATSLPGAPGVPAWPAGESWPDWFMLGDPHENYYAGEVYYDDIRLEVPRAP
ncbi:MAG TPA: hypothetical protein VFP65_18070 [Anaeromyxobacteraceae bacterium]|nr:hypothetical protein [Anaeromyxobacteraceae bacterium]